MANRSIPTITTAYRRNDGASTAVQTMLDIVPTAVRMPEPGQHVLMWETRQARWSVGSWCPRYQQWSNRDDPEYAIRPEHVSHWMPLPNACLSAKEVARP